MPKSKREQLQKILEEVPVIFDGHEVSLYDVSFGNYGDGVVEAGVVLEEKLVALMECGRACCQSGSKE